MVFKTARIVLVLSVLAPGVLFARTELYSFYSDRPAVYLDAIQVFAKAPRGTCRHSEGTIRAGIVTHHFLAHALMVGFFECLAARDRPDRILLIGPDHFTKGLQPITVSSLPWKTPFGEQEADTATAATIQEALGLSSDPEAFSGEHSIRYRFCSLNTIFQRRRLYRSSSSETSKRAN